MFRGAAPGIPVTSNEVTVEIFLKRRLLRIRCAQTWLNVPLINIPEDLTALKFKYDGVECKYILRLKEKE